MPPILTGFWHILVNCAKIHKMCFRTFKIVQEFRSQLFCTFLIDFINFHLSNDFVATKMKKYSKLNQKYRNWPKISPNLWKRGKWQIWAYFGSIPIFSNFWLNFEFFFVFVGKKSFAWWKSIFHWKMCKINDSWTILNVLQHILWILAQFTKMCQNPVKMGGIL